MRANCECQWWRLANGKMESNMTYIAITSATADATLKGFDVDFSELSQDIIMQLAAHGLKQKVNDCRGAWETVDEKDAASQKTLDAIMRGEFRANGATRTSDPVGREITRLANNLADQWAKKQNGKLVDVRKSQGYRDAVAKFRLNEKVIAKAKEIVASASELADLD
jgi:hypothetical protein